MNWLPIVINLLVAILVIVSLLIILLVLMQRPKNEGLGAAFGGGMTENLFGAQTTNVLQTITRYLGGIFFALTLLLSWLYVKKSTSGGSTLQQRLSAPTVIPATPAPTPPVPGAEVPGLPSATPTDPQVQLPIAPPAPAGDSGLKLEVAPPAPGASAVSDPVKAVPTTPAPAPGNANPAPSLPEGAKPEPVNPQAAKPVPAEKSADQPPATPAPPEKPGN